MAASHEQTSAPAVYLTVLLLLALGLGALLWFGITSLQLAADLAASDDALVFDKGATYLMGVGIAAIALTTSLIYEGVLHRRLSPSRNRLITRIALGGVIVMLVLPHAVHFALWKHLSARGFTVCAEASHQWLHSRTIAYASNVAACHRLAVQRAHGD